MLTAARGTHCLSGEDLVDFQEAFTPRADHRPCKADIAPILYTGLFIANVAGWDPSVLRFLLLNHMDPALDMYYADPAKTSHNGR